MELDLRSRIWEIFWVTTVTVDDRKRIRLPSAKPGQVFALEDSPDGGVTLTPVKAVASRSKRVTNVDPLPDEVLAEYYSRPERDEPGIERWIKAQPKGARD